MLGGLVVSFADELSSDGLTSRRPAEVRHE